MMIKHLFINAFFSLLILSCSVIANAMHVELSRLSTEEGLSVGYITNIIQDTDGYIWIATEMGLNRYDGYDVDTIKGPGGVLEREYIVELYHDESGKIWIGTQSSGIYSLDTHKGDFEHFNWPISASQESRTQFDISIVKSMTGSILLASSDKVFILEDKSNQFIPLIDFAAIFKNGEVIQNLDIHGSSLYISTSSMLYIYSFLNDTLKELPHLNDINAQDLSPKVKSIIVANGYLWIASIEGLFSAPLNKVEDYSENIGPAPVFKHSAEGLAVWGIVHKKKKLYLATSEGLFRFDSNTNNIEHLWKFSKSKYQLENNKISNLITDQNGNFWATSIGEGVYFWRPSTEQFTNVFRDNDGVDQLSNNMVWSLAEGKKDTLWIGTENGLNKLSLTEETINSYLVSKAWDKSTPKIVINYIFPDESNGLWLVTNQGLSYFDFYQNKLTAIKANSDEDRKILVGWITGAHLDSDGYIWFVGDKGYYKYNLKTGELIELDLTGLSEHIESTHRFLGKLPDQNTMLFSTQGKLWGIDVYTHKLTLIYRLPKSEKGLLFEVDSWVVDKNDILWLAFTGNSLIGLTMNGFELAYRLTSPDDIDDDIIYGLLMDDDGDLWFSSHSGLYHLKMDGMFIEHYSMKDGLPNKEFNEGAFTKINNNVFAYGSVKGVTLFSPDKLKLKTKRAPKVTISHISLLSPKVGRQKVNHSIDKLVLNYDEIGLKIGFSTLEYERQNETHYQFWVKGKESWKFPLSKDNTIQFGKLAAGNYVFNVQATSPFTGEIGEARKINIVVRHAPWYSPFAYFCYFSITVFIFIYWKKYRDIHIKELLEAHQKMQNAHDEMLIAKQTAEKANKAKSMFLANISHELRTPMHSILSFSKLSLKILASDSTHPKNDKLTRYSSNINQSGKRLLRLINNLLDIEKLISKKIDFNPKYVDFMAILTSALSEMEGYVMESKVKVVVDKNYTESTVWAEEHLILQVLINLLSNGVKFSPEGGILTLSIINKRLPHDNLKDGKSKNLLEFSIKDQGPGIPEDELQAIFDQFVQSSNIKAGTSGTGLGLAISQHILKLHNGEINVVNLPERGACFSFSLVTKMDNKLR